MNKKLFPNEVELDFVVLDKELFRIPEEIKHIKFNDAGSLVGVLSKTQKLYIFDFFGRSLLAQINYFYQKKYNINSFCFDDQNILYIAYELISDEKLNISKSGIKEINLEKELKNVIHSTNNKEEFILEINESKNNHEFFNKITIDKISEIFIDNNFLFICGNNPAMYDIDTENVIYFLEKNQNSTITNENNAAKNDLHICIDNIENSKKDEQNNNKNNKINLEKKESHDKYDNLSNEYEYNKINIDINIKNEDEDKQENENINIDSNKIEDNIKIDLNENNLKENTENFFELPNHPKIPEIQDFKYTIIIHFGYKKNIYYLIVKELYVFIILQKKDNETENYPSFSKQYENEKHHCTPRQVTYLEFLKNVLNKNFYAKSFYFASFEIINVEINEKNNLISINSTDKYLRLFHVIDDALSLHKEYFDVVNKRKYGSSFFLTFKLKSDIQDLILMELNDSNGLEFTFVDIDSNEIIQKLGSFKFVGQDFVCHYKNHFTILIISGKKIFCISGVMINQFACLAPGLHYLEENIDYIEDEAFYDNFDEKMKKEIHMMNNHEEKIEDIFSKKNKKNKKNKNIFIKFDYDNEILKNDNNIEREKSMNELKELFAFVGQQIQ